MRIRILLFSLSLVMVFQMGWATTSNSSISGIEPVIAEEFSKTAPPADKEYTKVINPNHALENLFRAEMPVNTRTCSKLFLTVGVTTAASKFLARVLVFFGLYNSHDES